MSNMVDIAKKQILRDEILEILKVAGSDGASIKVISLALKKAGLDISKRELDNEIFYLADKRLITKRDISNRRLGIDMFIYFISAKGVDVLEGSEGSAGIGE